MGIQGVSDPLFCKQGSHVYTLWSSQKVCITSPHIWQEYWRDTAQFVKCMKDSSTQIFLFFDKWPNFVEPILCRVTSGMAQEIVFEMQKYHSYFIACPGHTVKQLRNIMAYGKLGVWTSRSAVHYFCYSHVYGKTKKGFRFGKSNMLPHRWSSIKDITGNVLLDIQIALLHS